MTLQDVSGSPGHATDAAEATIAAAASGDAGDASPTQQNPQQTNRLAQCLAVPMQPLGSGLHSPSKQPLQSPGRFASPRPKLNGALAGLSVPGTTSQGTSGQDGDGDGDGDDGGETDEGEEDDGEGTDEQQGGRQQGKGRRRTGNNNGSSTPGRPQRVRKPKQYLGEEPEMTPTRSRRGSLPTTPASAGRRPVSSRRDAQEGDAFCLSAPFSSLSLAVQQQHLSRAWEQCIGQVGSYIMYMPDVNLSAHTLSSWAWIGVIHDAMLQHHGTAVWVAVSTRAQVQLWQWDLPPFNPCRSTCTACGCLVPSGERCCSHTHSHQPQGGCSTAVAPSLHARLRQCQEAAAQAAL